MGMFFLATSRRRFTKRREATPISGSLNEPVLAFVESEKS
jgi:hypothetical protein